MALFFVASVALAQTAAPTPVVTGNARVDKLLSQMTLAEKISMIHGAPEDPSTDQGQAGYLPAYDGWGFRLCDSPTDRQGC